MLEDTQLESLYGSMRMMIHSPWDPTNRQIMSHTEYADRLAKCGDKPRASCPGVLQSHGGNVYEHSVWATMQVKQWSEQGDPLMIGVDLPTAMVSTLLHDIGKGGDCIKYCDEHGVSWYDVYNVERYMVDGKQEEDGYHPNFSGQILLGQRPFYLSCSTHSQATLDISRLVRSLGGDHHVDVREVALAAYMHWELGRLNIGDTQGYVGRLQDWCDTFWAHCVTVGLAPTEARARLCVAVAAADISAGTNVRIQGDQALPVQYAIQDVPGMVYASSDPWIQFRMGDNVHRYQQDIVRSVRERYVATSTDKKGPALANP